MNNLYNFDEFELNEGFRDQFVKFLTQGVKKGPKAIQEFIDKNLKKPILKKKPSVDNLKKRTVTRSITPIGYDPLKLINIPSEILLPKMAPKAWTTQNRYDAWYVYNGLKQKYGTFTKIAENTYRINKFALDVEVLKKIIDNPKKSIPTAEIQDQLNFGAIHGNGMVTKGKDAKGMFLEFTDEWDLQPLKVFNFLPKMLRNFEMSQLSGGRPFFTKNKIYYKTNSKGVMEFFDETLTPLIKSKETIKNADFSGVINYVKTKNLQGVSQQKALEDWNKIQSYGMSKTAFTVLFPLVAVSVKNYLNSQEREKQLYLKLIEYGNKKGWTLEQVKKHFSDEKGVLGGKGCPNKKEFDAIYRSIK
jgi:hypothetical protein